MESESQGIFSRSVVDFEVSWMQFEMCLEVLMDEKVG